MDEMEIAENGPSDLEAEFGEGHESVLEKWN